MFSFFEYDFILSLISLESFRFNFKLNLKLSNGIEESIRSLSKNENTIILCVGSLYLAGEILSLN